MKTVTKSTTTKNEPTTTLKEEAMHDNSSPSNAFKPSDRQYLIPFITVAVIAIFVFTFGVFISRQAYRGKMSVNDLELAIALMKAGNRQQASANNGSSGEKTEQSGKATTRENRIDQSSGASHSSDAGLADGNYATVLLEEPLWANMAYAGPSCLSKNNPPAGDCVPLEVIVPAASETNSEDMGR